jgi:broad specificity phosphatase PhoE
VSTLQCEATLVVARHADAAYVETFFSDEGGALTLEGRRQAAALADALRGRRIAHVWCSDSSRCVQTAEIAASRLGVGVTPRKALREVYVGELTGEPFSLAAIEKITDQWLDGDLAARFPGGESGEDVVARHREELGAIADLHRGETVLVVAHQTAAGFALPVLTGRLSRAWCAEHQLRNGEAAELVVDADDWQLRGWGPVSLG